MCGIFGVISLKPLNVDWIAELGHQNQVRGNLAFGGVTLSPYQTTIFRLAAPFTVDKIPLTEAHGMLGHIHAPTGGQSTDLRGIHPFETDRLLLAHNGILLNHHQFSAWRSIPDLDVDSQVILGGIEDYWGESTELLTAITETLAQLEGQHGCWLWVKETPMLYLWWVMSSLYYTRHADCFVFSSVCSPLAEHLLPEGKIYQLNLFTLEFTPQADFPFYSPYKVAR